MCAAVAAPCRCCVVVVRCCRFRCCFVVVVSLLLLLCCCCRCIAIVVVVVLLLPSSPSIVVVGVVVAVAVAVAVTVSIVIVHAFGITFCCHVVEVASAATWLSWQLLQQGNGNCPHHVLMSDRASSLIGQASGCRPRTVPRRPALRSLYRGRQAGPARPSVPGCRQGSEKAAGPELQQQHYPHL